MLLLETGVMVEHLLPWCRRASFANLTARLSILLGFILKWKSVQFRINENKGKLQRPLPLRLESFSHPPNDELQMSSQYSKADIIPLLLSFRHHINQLLLTRYYH